MITDSQIENGQLKADLKEMVMYTLLRKHRHQTKKSNLRSLADIGKSVSSASRLFTNQENGNTAATLNLSLTLYRFPHLSSHFHRQHLSDQSFRTSLTHLTNVVYISYRCFLTALWVKEKSHLHSAKLKLKIL